MSGYHVLLSEMLVHFSKTYLKLNKMTQRFLIYDFHLSSIIGYGAGGAGVLPGGGMLTLTIEVTATDD